MLVLLDNYDSFTFNLAQYIMMCGAEVEVFRNDRITLEEIEEMRPSGVVISPGPCTPNEAGISLDAARRFAGRIPLLGVCLGHQTVGQAFGARVVRAPDCMHGKVSVVEHDGSSALFSGIPSRFRATRYHSLIVERETLPDSIRVTAQTDDGLIMALEHREYPVFGVQFHPEAILTEHGLEVIRNFLAIAGEPGVSEPGISLATVPHEEGVVQS